MSSFNDDEVQVGLENLDMKMVAAFDIYCTTAAKKLETYAKKNRPWTDRTSDARKRLQGTSELVGGNRARIVLAHGVDYGVWLELAHEKRYAIVEPTVRLQSNEILKGLENFVGRLEGDTISLDDLYGGLNG